MLDRFIRGRVARISPEAPVPVVEVNQPETQHLGGAGNVAANLAALGARATAFGVVGRDEAGRVLRRELSRNRIGAAGIVTDPGRPTTVKMRIIAVQADWENTSALPVPHQHIVRADWESAAALSQSVQRRLLTGFKQLVSRLDGVVISDYDKGVVTEGLVNELLRECRKHDLPVFLDLKVPRSFDSGLTLVLVNQWRAERIVGQRIEGESSLLAVAEHIVRLLQCSVLVITRGAKGMVVFEHGETIGKGRSSLHIDAVYRRPLDLFDRTGAGDTVLSVLSLAMVSGATPIQAATIATSAGSIVVNKWGTAVVTPQELLESLTGKRRG